MIGYPDKPVASVTEDLFNIEVYVNALCSFIKNCETPMTISIQGDWGSGKTSMMNMMMANMQGTVCPIWFNTWQFSQFDMGNSLAFSMIDSILKDLDCKDDIRKKIINGLFGFGKNIIKNISDYTFGGEITGIIRNALDGEAVTIDLASEITQLKNRLTEAIKAKLEKEHRDRVVIFVDDLDRLQPSKAVELLEVLKLFLDCDSCIFVLAVDYEVVVSGIRQKFGSDISSEKGRSFFDKIIQLPFKMPVANYNIRRYVEEMMARMDISTKADDVNLFFNLIHNSIGFNPRSMKRLFNTYELLDIVTASTIKNIDNLVRKRVLFAIICTQMCFEKLYLYLTSTIIDNDTFLVLIDEHTRESSIKEIYGESQNENQNEEIQKAINFIPYFIDALQIDDDDALSQDELNNLRVILKCSVITSINAKAEEFDSDLNEWEYRNKNKDLVKKAASNLLDIGKFVIWMPRKSRLGVKFSDVSGWYTWQTDLGFSCTLEYYLTRLSEFIICVNIHIILYEGKGQEEIFFDALGDNPLKLSIPPYKEKSGSYIYTNVLRLNANDITCPDQISSVTKNAYKSLIEIIELYKSKFCNQAR